MTVIAACAAFPRATFDRLGLRSTGWNLHPSSSSRPLKLVHGSPKFPSRCGQTSVAARRTSAAPVMAGAICGSCCFTLPIGFFCFPGLSCALGPCAGFLAFARPSTFDLAHCSGHSHHDLRRHLHAIGRPNHIRIGFFAKVFSYAERFDHNPVSLKRLLLRVKLEHGLLVAPRSLSGFVGSARIAWHWAASGFGPLR